MMPIVGGMHALQWRHNERDGVSNHQPDDCLLNGLFGCRSKKTSKLRVTCLGEGNSPVTGEFPTQRANNVEHVSIWWPHHGSFSTEPHCNTADCSLLSGPYGTLLSPGYPETYHQQMDCVWRIEVEPNQVPVPLNTLRSILKFYQNTLVHIFSFINPITKKFLCDWVSFL